ncbi:autotransporter strand-loop-strand O-heptosyltransferase [Buttiauxella sp. 3AFRM03]|uniref:autotransporter strand-loop-strand O-heptosyltransferase n=1 Tax=Buttiauxella sp. 3AFRM03 TaxID=2479367 RepID=UPI000EF84630|nr:autotransporter strand-loop-strand O-heptosyltransferase [Buttiauxella sp. 3AFRM03]AYN27027.1 autotransporter strand-loop-strand O-heptosyltransferase [Buttiauxella sp. 3AFRM03]
MSNNSTSLHSVASAAAAPQESVPFLLPPEFPTQTGPLGIRYDFNDGARVWLPQGQWHVQIRDADSDNILFACDSDEGWVTSAKKFFVRFSIRVFRRGEKEPVLDHTLDLTGQDVLVSFPVGTLGDLIGWVPYAERFREQHQCQLECTMGPLIIDLFAASYPDIRFTEPANYTGRQPYASYRVGLYFQGNLNNQPIDFRMVGLHRTAGHILGTDPTEIQPVLALNAPRTIPEPYVCIATKASCQAKFWNNGTGWNEVVDYLKAQGYRVLCIDQKATVGQGFVWNHIPHGAEDFTGDIPLSERVALLQHADFFIGLSSGLSWLAWACRIPVVLISGFTLPNCEFSTPYRVFSPHVCNGCWDDVRIDFDHKDFLWCPRHKGTERQYECSRAITGQQVIGHLRRLQQTHLRFNNTGDRASADTAPVHATRHVKEIKCTAV